MSDGYIRRNINGDSPLDLKNMNDNFKYLWLKVFGGLENADISDDANISGSKLKAKSVTADEIDGTNLHVNSANIDGTINADTVKSSWMYTGKITADQIEAGEIVGCTLKTANTLNYVKIENQYLSIFSGNDEKIRIGYDTYLNPDTCPYIKLGDIELSVNGSGLNVGGYLLQSGSQVLTESNWGDYISMPSVPSIFGVGSRCADGVSGNFMYFKDLYFEHADDGRCILHVDANHYVCIDSSVLTWVSS